MEAQATYTLSEAAELLRCHPETVRRYVKSGKLRGAKIGKEYRFSKSDLEEFWAAQGGGALFVDSPKPLEPPKPRPESEKKKSGPKQFKLPT